MRWSTRSAAGRSKQRSGLQDQACHESTGEADHKDGRGYHRDQVNGPRVVVSTHKFDMAGAVFVSICVKAHGSSLHLLSEGPPLACQNITFSAARGLVDHRDEKIVRALAP